MKLFHSFPRPSSQPNSSSIASNTRRLALATLQSIFEFGLLCTPEKLKIHPAANSESPEKQKLLDDGLPEYVHCQSRMCFTLCELRELFSPKIHGLVPGEIGPVVGSGSMSHSDLFGPYAISFDPLVSRRLGIVPTTYFAPSDLFGGRFSPLRSLAPGLGIQMIQRIKEMRELLIAIAMIERSVELRGAVFPGEEMLALLKLELPYEQVVVQKIESISYRTRKMIVELLDIDREMAFNLVSFTDMLLSLFQETDSSFDGSVLAFYQQREWRLIHHMRPGMVWYCVGDQPDFRNPLREARLPQIGELRRVLEKCALGRSRDDGYFQNCWLLESVDGLNVSDYIEEVIAPRESISEVRELLMRVGSVAGIIPAEDFGYLPPDFCKQ